MSLPRLLARVSVALVLLAPLGALAQPWPASDLPAAAAWRVRVPADGAPARGAARPLVTIVTFSDFQCPFCARAVPTMERLLREHPEEVRLVFRHQPLPFHEHAMLAAEAAVEAMAQGGTNAFWSMHDVMFQNQRALTVDDLARYAGRLDLDVERFRAALGDHRHRPTVQADIDLAARVGNRGTPGFFVNGRHVSGAQPYDVFDTVVQEEIALVREGLRRGVARGAVYERLMNGAHESVPAPPPRATRPAQRTRDVEAVYSVPLLPRQPVRGRADALVTLVAFTDVECPFCRRAHGTVEELRRRYPRELRVAIRNNPLPFHEGARPAAMAMLEARAQRGPRAYWRMYDLLMEGEARHVDRETLEAHARTLHLNLRRFRRALDEETHAEAIAADQALARRLGARGTPSFYINGRLLVGAQPIEAFVALVDEELARARARVRRGTPRRSLYTAIVAEGATEMQYLAPGEVATRQVSVAVPEDAPSRGPADAPLVIQVFADFECTWCGVLADTLDRILRAYDGQVRLIFRSLPLDSHPEARAAARAAAEVRRQGGDRAFWRYHDLLYTNQQDLGEAELVALAERVPGVDAEAVRAAIGRSTHDARIDAASRDLRNAGLVPSTPLLVVGDRLVRGRVAYDDIRGVVERQLTER